MWDLGGRKRYAPGDDTRSTSHTDASPPSTPASSHLSKIVVITVPRGQSHSSHRRVHHHSHSPVREPHSTSNATRPSGSRPHSPQIVQGPRHYIQPTWQYSRCTGKRKALCIGINYFGTPEELCGCINDAHAVHRFLVDHNYKPQDIVVLTDDAQDPRQRPTRQNICDAMRWLVRGTRQDDALFFHYSGHGEQTKDNGGDEEDGYDQVILPSDFRSAGVITDDDMHDMMVAPLPVGCRLTALFDSCHSGTMLTLPYLYRTDGRAEGSQFKARAQKAKPSPADVVLFSSCDDNEMSADIDVATYAAGAMSHTFIASLCKRPNQTYAGLLKSLRGMLGKKYRQKPQLSSSHLIDTDLRFII